MTEQELQPKAKEEAPAKGERVRPGRVFVPAVDIFETPETLVLVADMPGVSGDKVTLDLKENHLTIYGDRRPAPGAGGGHGGPGILHRRLPAGLPPGEPHRSEQDRGHHEGRGAAPGDAQSGEGQTPEDRSEGRLSAAANRKKPECRASSVTAFRPLPCPALKGRYGLGEIRLGMVQGPSTPGYPRLVNKPPGPRPFPGHRNG